MVIVGRRRVVRAAGNAMFSQKVPDVSAAAVRDAEDGRVAPQEEEELVDVKGVKREELDVALAHGEGVELRAEGGIAALRVAQGPAAVGAEEEEGPAGTEGEVARRAGGKQAAQAVPHFGVPREAPALVAVLVPGDAAVGGAKSDVAVPLVAGADPVPSVLEARCELADAVCCGLAARVHGCM